MMLYVLKALSAAGLILDVILLYRKIKSNQANMTPELEAQLAFGKKKAPYNMFVGIIVNFFDTLGIGCYATSMAMYKFGKSIYSEDLVPGTLNAGATFPVMLEAFLFFGFVEVDYLTLILMIVSSVIGAYLGAGWVSKLDVHSIKLVLALVLCGLGIIMFVRQQGWGPFGTAGDALKLTGIKLVIGVVVNFILGVLMCVGFGLYAPCIALVSILGMNIGAAFPIMMGSCGFLMAFGNGPKFIKENKFDTYATLGQTIGGAIGVLLAYYVVKSMNLTTLLYIVCVVVEITALKYLMEYISEGKKA